MKIRHSARIEINLPKAQCVFGMIKLGCNYSNNVISSVGVKICLDRDARLVFEGSAVVGNGSSIEVRHGGKICIGKNFGNTGTLTMCSDCEINIGNNVSCSWDVSILDTDMHSYIDVETGQPASHKSPVRIGDFVWICQKCTLLKGAVLPRWSILGACSLLSKDLVKITPFHQDFTVYAGSPARSINKRLRRDDLYQIFLATEWMITSGLRIINKLPNTDK